MRKITAGMFMSLDGVVESPGDFVFPYFNEEVGQVVGSYTDAADTVLMGRKLYQEWADYWPGKTAADDPFAEYINNTAKVVVSNTLKSVDWKGTTLVSGDMAAAIRQLKQQPGKNIGMSGSPTLLRSLLHEGLVDELALLVFPVVVGHGQRLFQDFDERLPFKLARSRTTETGVLILDYAL